MVDQLHGLWSACPNESILAYGIEGALVGVTFAPTPDESWRGNPDEIRSFRAEWEQWVYFAVQESIQALALDDQFHGGTEEFTVYEDDSNGTKVIVGQQGQAGVLYLIAYKM